MRKIIEDCQVENVDNFVKNCDVLYELLIEYNQKVNLTRITKYNDFWIKHIIDSLIIGKFFPEITQKKLKIADIGCGAGFPSIVLALAYPNLKVYAIDSIAKKTAFVAYAKEQLKIQNLEVITGRSRELNNKKEFQKRFDIVCARAVAEALTIYKDASNFINNQGRFILYKTPEQILSDFPAVKTLKNSRKKWCITDIYELPENAGNRQFLYQQN